MTRKRNASSAVGSDRDEANVQSSPVQPVPRDSGGLGQLLAWIMALGNGIGPEDCPIHSDCRETACPTVMCSM